MNPPAYGPVQSLTKIRASFYAMIWFVTVTLFHFAALGEEALKEYYKIKVVTVEY